MTHLALFVLLVCGGVRAATAGDGSQTVSPPGRAALGWRDAYFTGEPLRFGNRVQYLCDDYAVEDRYALRRVVGPVEKHPGNPLRIGPDLPWETSTDEWWGANLRHVVYDPGERRFKGWYATYRVEPDSRGSGRKFNYDTLYAESRDGITWVKPELDLFLRDGRKTNIVLHQERETALLEEVLFDGAARDPAHRFVALVKTVPPGETQRCVVRMHSADGRRWKLAENAVLFRGTTDGAYSLARDEERDRWILLRRPPTRALVNTQGDFYAARNLKRRVSVALSRDLVHWTYPRNVVILDELDDASLAQPGNRMDIDWGTTVRAEGIFFGFLTLMDNLKVARPAHSHLMWSRDGLDWERLPERPCFIENGAPGEWDAGTTRVGSLVTHGDRIHIYYNGRNRTEAFHGQPGERNYPSFNGTGLAFIGRDRFVGLQAGPEGGFLLTRQFVLEGDQIELNCRAHARNPAPGALAQVRAEILQPAAHHLTAEAFPGFTLGDSVPVSVTDDYRLRLAWKGKASLAELRGKPVYVRLHLRNVTLYTLRIAAGG